MANFDLWFIFFTLFFWQIQCSNVTFVPTEEWQTIEEGVNIPQGLHVRVNLNSGKKEAKLLEKGENNKASKSSLISLESNTETPIDQDKLKQYLKNIKSDENKIKLQEKDKFRSYDEIKKEFTSAKMNVETDVELLNRLIMEYRSLRIKSDIIDKQQRLEAIIIDLEYLVHQYDNAVEFARLQGFQEIIVPSLNSSDGNLQLRSTLLNLLGSTVQNHPRVQKIALDSGCVSLLLRILIKVEDTTVRSRALYATSCLLRSFPPGQFRFLKQGGLSVLAAIFDDTKHPSAKVQYKILNLITDLLRDVHYSQISDNHVHRDAYDSVRKHMNVLEGGWCSRVSDWFLVFTKEWNGKDHSMLEATIDLLIELAGEDCLSDFVVDLKLVSGVNLTREVYKELVLQDQDDGIFDSYYSLILDKLKTFGAILARTTKYKDEL